MKFCYLILLNIICFNSILTNEEFRVIKLTDLPPTEDSYLPVKSGSKFLIELEGNPTTGYIWMLESSEVVLQGGSLLTPLNLNDKKSAEFFKKPHDKYKLANETGRLGVGGFYHFKFKVDEERSGMQRLTFVYKKPWLENDEDVIRKSIEVKVVHPRDISEL